MARLDMTLLFVDESQNTTHSCTHTHAYGILGHGMLRMEFYGYWDMAYYAMGRGILPFHAHTHTHTRDIGTRDITHGILRILGLG